MILGAGCLFPEPSSPPCMHACSRVVFLKVILSLTTTEIPKWKRQSRWPGSDPPLARGIFFLQDNGSVRDEPNQKLRGEQYRTQQKRGEELRGVHDDITNFELISISMHVEVGTQGSKRPAPLANGLRLVSAQYGDGPSRIRAELYYFSEFHRDERF